ncbi:MAG: hypothetical protein VW684_15795, partial [Betaproteobacteria bacterium]
ENNGYSHSSEQIRREATTRWVLSEFTGQEYGFKFETVVEEFLVGRDELLVDPSKPIRRFVNAIDESQPVNAFFRAKGDALVPFSEGEIAGAQFAIGGINLLASNQDYCSLEMPAG